RLRELLAGDARLVERRWPVAVQSLEMSPVHQATPSERDEVGLPVAPPCQRLRPFLRPTELVHLFAGEDDAAVHDPADDRRDLPRRDPHHPPVAQTQSLGDATAL